MMEITEEGNGLLLQLDEGDDPYRKEIAKEFHLVFYQWEGF